MIEFIYIPLILFLYLRTYKYNVLIDDPVPRDGYMYVITTEKTDPKLYEVRRSLLATFTNIGVFIAVCSYLHYLFGWKAALLFAVMPLNVSGVAWSTGNYYMSTVLLVLFGHMLIIKFGLIGVIGSLLVYTAALNSTLSSLSYIAVALFFPYGWLLIWPLVAFLKGKRMKAGLSQRTTAIKNERFDVGFSWSNLILCPKLIAYYIVLSFFPMKLGFFHDWGRGTEFRYKRTLALSCILCLLFWYWMLSYDWVMALWWFSSIALFSQFVIFGQFTTERYTYLANVAFCVVLSQFVTNDIAFAILTTMWVYRSLEYIPNWRHNKFLFSYSITQFPKAPENYNNLGSFYLDSGNALEAYKPLLAAEHLSVGSKHRVRANLAACFGMMSGASPKYLYDARKWLHIALQDVPDNKKEILEKQLTYVNNRIVDYEKVIRKYKKKRNNG